MTDQTQAVPPPEPTQPMPTGRRVVRRAGAGVLILAALAAGRVVTSAYESDDSLSDPYLVAGSLGRPVSLRNGQTVGPPWRSRAGARIAPTTASAARSASCRSDALAGIRSVTRDATISCGGAAGRSSRGAGRG